MELHVFTRYKNKLIEGSSEKVNSIIILKQKLCYFKDFLLFKPYGSVHNLHFVYYNDSFCYKLVASASIIAKPF